MEISDHDDDFQEELREYIYRISRCSTRSQAVVLRTNALRLVDQWRAQRLEQLDQHVRLAGQWILQAYDQRPGKSTRIPSFDRFAASRSATGREVSTSGTSNDTEHLRQSPKIVNASLTGQSRREERVHPR